jgi:hypothetical protein
MPLNTNVLITLAADAPNLAHLRQAARTESCSSPLPHQSLVDIRKALSAVLRAF